METRDDEFERKLTLILDKAEYLRFQLEEGVDSSSKDILVSFVETLEELHVVHEELVHSNIELENSRNQLEIERYKYQELFKQSPDGYLVTDLRGTIQSANLIISKMLCYSPKMLIGKPLSVFVHQDDIGDFYSKLNHIAEHKVLRNWELNLVNKNKNLFPVSMTVAVIYCDENGKSQNLYFSVRDLHERARVQDELHKSLGKLENKIEQRTQNMLLALNSMAEREVRMAELKKVIVSLRKQIIDASLIPVANDPWLE